MTGQPAAERIVRCRYLQAHPRHGLNQCTSEAADPEGEILLCVRHLALAIELWHRRAAELEEGQ